METKMKLDDIIGKVADSTGLSRRDVKKAVEGAFAEIKSVVDSGEKVAIPGMGSFQLKEREAGEVVSRTGEPVTVSAARYVTFKPSRAATGRGPKKPSGKKSAQAPAV
jgi:DNA-binding protein HU-beta